MSSTTLKHIVDARFAGPIVTALGPWLSSYFRGLASGFRAYRILGELEAMTDPELASRGLQRKDLPRAAMEAARVFERG